MTGTSTKRRFTTKEMTSMAIMTAVTCIMAQIAIPMPAGVPMTMQTFAITLAGVILGSRAGAISILVYVFLGIIGVPVLANFTGGVQCLVGPTGGFLISFPLMAYVSGLAVEQNKKWKFVVLLVLAAILNYVAGVVFFCFVMKSTVGAAMMACVVPFIPTAIVKLIIGGMCGLAIRKRLGETVQWS